MKNVTALMTGKITISILLGYVSYLLGGFDTIIQTLLILIICDFISALCGAVKEGTLNSKKCAEGVGKKVMYFVIIVTAVACQKIIPDTPLRESVTMFFIASEGLSIIENASKFIKLPTNLIKFFENIGGNKNE